MANPGNKTTYRVIVPTAEGRSQVAEFTSAAAALERFMEERRLGRPVWIEDALGYEITGSSCSGLPRSEGRALDCGSRALVSPLSLSRHCKSRGSRYLYLQPVQCVAFNPKSGVMSHVTRRREDRGVADPVK